MPLARTRIESPVGVLTLVAHEAALVALLWENDRPGRVPLGDVMDAREHTILTEAAAQLQDYFAGIRQHFDLPVDLAGTPFQKKVWAQLQAIPFGKTRTYGAIAEAVGNPKAARAVGAAIGRNPVSIIVPCHRAVGAKGALTGFAGGIETKRYLLTIEAQGTGGGPRVLGRSLRPIHPHQDDESDRA